MNTIVIDSSRRTSNYPSNNQWTYKLDESFKNIKSFKLNGCMIPNTQYLINSNNNSLVVTHLATDYTFTLTNGFYTPSTLATELQTQLNTNAFGATFTVTQSTVTNKYRLQCTASIIYKFASNTILGKILGFGSSDTASTADVYSTNVYNLGGVKYYRLEIEEANNQIVTNISTSKNQFIIPNNVNSGEYNYITNSNNIINNIENLQKDILKFTIKLYDDEDNFVDLNGADYLLFFGIEN